MTQGVYMIRNRIVNKMYVGSSIRIESRWHVHIHQLDKGIHENMAMQNDWIAHGRDAFQFAIIEIVKDLSELRLQERAWVNTLDSKCNGYNTTTVAVRTPGRAIYVGCDIDNNMYKEFAQKMEATGIPIASFIRTAIGLCLDDVLTVTKEDIKLYSKETLNRGGKRR